MTDVVIIMIFSFERGAEAAWVQAVVSSVANARDVERVLEALSLVGPPVFGISQGAPFRALARRQRVVSRVAIASGQDELAHPTMRAQLPPDVAAIAGNRDGLESSFAERVDAAGLWSLVLGMSAPARRDSRALARLRRDALRRLPNARRQVFADEGGAIAWTRTTMILRALLEADAR